MSQDCIHIGLYGTNGHQLPLDLPEQARVVAVAEYAKDVPESIRTYDDLEALLDDPNIDLISLCSARRADQAQQAMQCLKAGKHVLAEKPCTFDAHTLDQIIETARHVGREFREMAASNSNLQSPIQAIRRLVDDGSLGTIVHVQAHKSYPWHDRRPQDIDVDGGLVRQVGIHAVRLIHGGTGIRIKRVVGSSTGLGNPAKGGQNGIQMAATFSVELENGSVGTINLNYLNPPNFGAWGNDQLRVFGTKGMVDTVDGFRRHSLYLPGRDEFDLPFPDDLVSPMTILHYVNYLLHGTPMPMSFEEEMAMTRAMLAMHEAAVAGEWIEVQYPDLDSTIRQI